jgi:zinc transport system substrate-binding protein
MKQFMKQILFIGTALILAVGLSGALSACTSGQQQTQQAGLAAPSSEKVRIVTSIFPPYDFCRALAGDKAEISMLLPPASESHSFEPTPADIIRIQNCDIFIYGGGESDEWVAEVLESMDTSSMKLITMMDCVSPVEEEVIEGMEEEAEEEGGAAEEAEYDEHVWTAPQNARLIVEKISATLCEVDPDNSSTYQKNTTAYLAKLDDLDRDFREVAAGAKRKTVVFGDRFPFRYFADAYGLDYFAAFPGCSTETEANAATVKFLIDKVKAEDIPVVFHIELSNAKIADTISEATGAKVRELHAVHNISKDDFEQNVGYLELMRRNVDALKEALM